MKSKCHVCGSGTSPFKFAVGSIVRHAMRRAEHDDWRGMVLERRLTEGQISALITYNVRWIKPDGCPNGDTTTMDEQELVALADKLDPPAQGTEGAT